ncbi:MFS transporter [Providencia vermicola]|uniref:MFS transporter n=1 Tax=Providencia vermicola TaxID=333965 RepID=UPI0034D5CECC
MQKKMLPLSFVCLLITVFLDQIGLFLIYPIIPSLLESVTHNSVIDNAIIGGWLLATFGIMQFIFAPIMGALSDKFGRKPVLIVCFVVFTLDYFLYAISHNLYLLFVARIIAGIAGSSIIVSLASVADMSDERSKMQNYGFLFGIMSLGIVVGPAIASIAVQYGVRVPFFVACILSFIGLLCVIFLFKETLPIEKRRAFKLHNPFSSIIYFFKYKGLFYLFIANIVFMFAVQFPTTLWPFFTKYRFEWDDVKIATSFVIIGLGGLFAQTVLLKIVRVFLSDQKIPLLGFLLFIIGLISIAFSTSVVALYIAIILYSFSSISNSSIVSLFSSQVSDSEQGQLMGALSSISSFWAVLGPLCATNMYYYSANLSLPSSDGYPFVFSAILVLICILPLSIGLKNAYSMNHSLQQDEDFHQ